MASIPMPTFEGRAAIVKTIKSHWPWFEPNPGFQFLWDNSPAIVIGWGSYRSWDFIGNVTVTQGDTKICGAMATFTNPPASLLFSYEYKGEWYIRSFHEVLLNNENIEDIQSI